MKPHRPDKLLITLFVVLLCLGLFSLFDASSVRGQIAYNNPFYYLQKQVLFLVAGMVVFWIMYKVPHQFWKKFAFLIILAGFASMLLVFMPHIGLSLKGATRWIALGSFTVQPSEFFKLCLIIYLASFLSKHQDKLDDFTETTMPIGIILGATALVLAAQRSLGVLLITLLIAGFVYFLSGAPLKALAILGAVFAVVAIVLIKTEPYRMQRVLTFLHPDAANAQGSGYQVNQALIGIGSGGMFGVGLGHSRQKFSFLPETMGDSIFAIWAEETGFAGVSALLVLIGLFVWRGFTAARYSKDLYAKLLAAGITCWIAVQTLFNIAAISGLIPLSGIPLPFFSYGGSALISILAAYGLLLNVSCYTVKK